MDIGYSSLVGCFLVVSGLMLKIYLGNNRLGKDTSLVFEIPGGQNGKY